MMRKREYVEEPLNYWEEKSFMMILPNKEDDDLLKTAIKNVSSSKEIKLIDQNFNLEEKVIYLKIEYEKEEYEVGILEGGVSIPMYYLGGIQFTDSEREAIINARTAITLFMKFDDNFKKCYHLQLKLAVTMIPDLIGVMDESAEKMLSRRWVNMASKSKVLPSSKDLFSIQAVLGKKEKVWLHTHGLCRCGFTELEIVDSDVKNQQNHYNLLNTYAMYVLDKKGNFDPRVDSAYIGRLINGYPAVVTCESWTTGLQEYKKLKLGGYEDRTSGHNTFTSLVFLYKSEEDEKNRVLSKITDYNELWGDNPLFFFSDEETDRMKELARERFNYVKKAFENKYPVLLKIGLPLKEEGQYEHIWFELLKFNGNKFKGRLTQEPYYFEDIHEGYEAWYTKDNVTDWIVYTPNYSVNPDNAYLLDDDE